MFKGTYFNKESAGKLIGDCVKEILKDKNHPLTIKLNKIFNVSAIKKCKHEYNKLIVYGTAMRIGNRLIGDHYYGCRKCNKKRKLYKREIEVLKNDK